MEISVYWCQIFVLPKRCLNSICRAFLCFGNIESHIVGLVKWQEVCKPKRVGGLGIKNIHVWNQITVGKSAWHIHIMKDSLWVRWVHGLYTKGGK